MRFWGTYKSLKRCPQEKVKLYKRFFLLEITLHPVWYSCNMAPEKKVWDKKNPNKKSTPLTSAQKTAAKARAKKAGRPYPNLVDNMAAAKKKK